MFSTTMPIAHDVRVAYTSIALEYKAGFCGVLVAQSLVFSVVLCTSLSSSPLFF